MDPFLAALLFAGDRLESKPLLEAALAEHDVVVLDRYVASNVAHQGAKREGDERTELVRRIEHVEYALNALPRPDVTVWLDLPVPLATRLIAAKAARDYTDEGRRSSRSGRRLPRTGRRGVRRPRRGAIGSGCPAPRAGPCGVEAIAGDVHSAATGGSASSGRG